jgi:hypothetical protein
MVVTIDLAAPLDIVMEIITEEVAAIDVVRMVIIATTMRKENKIEIEMKHKNNIYL